MSQLVHEGAKRQMPFSKLAEGPIPDFPQCTLGGSLSAGAAFATAKAVTAELAISAPVPVLPFVDPAPARSLSTLKPCIRQDTVFSRVAAAQALLQKQGTLAPPLPQSCPSPSLGIFPFDDAGAPAPHPLSSSQKAQGNSWPTVALGKVSSNGHSIFDNNLKYQDFAEETDVFTDRSTPVEPPTGQRLDWEEHYQKRGWAMRCRKLLYSGLKYFRGSLESIQEEILSVTNAINKARANLRCVKIEQLRFPGFECTAKKRSERDVYNALMRRKRDLYSSLAQMKTKIETYKSYISILDHNTITCRDYVIPHHVKRKLKNGQDKVWTTPSSGFPEMHFISSGLEQEKGVKNLNLHYKWFRHCGNVFFCRACSKKKGTTRREQLKKLMQWCVKERHLVVHVSLTIPHSLTDIHTMLVDNLLAAYSKMIKSRDWVSFSAETGLIGVVKVLESTWSDANGAHPHLHLLLVLNASSIGIECINKDRVKDFCSNIQSVLRQMWTKVCCATGIVTKKKEKDHMRYGCSAVTREGSNMGSYFSKMAPFEESSPVDVSNTNEMSEKPKNLSYWKVFQLAAQEKNLGKYSTAYLEYMIAMNRRRSCTVSPSLREYMTVPIVKSKTDYLFHFEPKERKHNKEGILISGISQTQNHVPIFEKAWGELAGSLTYEHGRFTYGDSFLRVKLCDKDWSALFPETRQLSRQLRAQISFTRDPVVKMSIPIPDSKNQETSSMWLKISNECDVWGAA